MLIKLSTIGMQPGIVGDDFLLDGNENIEAFLQCGFVDVV